MAASGHRDFSTNNSTSTSTRFHRDWQYTGSGDDRYTKPNNSYFSDSGITQLAYVRKQLEDFKATSEEGQTAIKVVLDIIDGLADKSFGSSVKVLNRIKNLQSAIANAFPANDGAGIAFHHLEQLQVANILTSGLEAIRGDDLKAHVGFLSGYSTQDVGACIQKTALAVGSQVRFLLHLYRNCENGDAFQKTFNELTALEATWQLKERNKEIKTDDIKIVAEQYNQILNRAIDSPACGIILKEQGRSRTTAFSECFNNFLKVTNPISCMPDEMDNALDLALHRIKENTFLITLFVDVIFTRQALSLLETVGNIFPDESDEKTSMHTKYHELYTKKALRDDEVTLLELFETFKTTLSSSYNQYIQGSDHNKLKASIIEQVCTQLEKYKITKHTEPTALIAYIGKLIGLAYDAHNTLCTESKMLPGRTGEILDQAMKQLADMISRVSCSDSPTFLGLSEHYKEFLPTAGSSFTPQR